MNNQNENEGCLGRRAAAVGLGAMPEAGPAPFTAEQFWTVMLTVFNELFTTEITRERVEQASRVGKISAWPLHGPCLSGQRY